VGICYLWIACSGYFNTSL